MLKKLCSKCGKVIKYGKARCSKCEQQYQDKIKQYKENNKDYYKKYNKEKRDNQSFYNSKSWNLTRKQINNRDRGLCRLCYSKGIITYSECVHHIEEVKENIELRCDNNNLISLCSKCHKDIHIKYKYKADDTKDKLREIIKENI